MNADRWSVRLALLVAVGLALPACGGNGDVFDIAPNVVVGTDNVEDRVPMRLRFDHSVGSTECPQTIDRWTVTNDRSDTITITISASDSALSASPNAITLAPGESTEVTVVFTCSMPSDVEETLNIEVQAEDGTTIGNTTIEVQGSVS